MKRVVSTDNPEDEETISWAADHVSLKSTRLAVGCVALTYILSLFYDHTKAVAMIRHSMDVVKKAVEILNLLGYYCA